MIRYIEINVPGVCTYLAAANRWDESVLVTLSIYQKNIKYFLSPEIILRLMSFDLKLLRGSPGGCLPFEYLFPNIYKGLRSVFE